MRGTPPPQTQPPPLSAYGLRQDDLRAYGAQAQRDTYEKNPSYGLGYAVIHRFFSVVTTQLIV